MRTFPEFKVAVPSGPGFLLQSSLKDFHCNPLRNGWNFVRINLMVNVVYWIFGQYSHLISFSPAANKRELHRINILVIEIFSCLTKHNSRLIKLERWLNDCSKNRPGKNYCKDPVQYTRLIFFNAFGKYAGRTAPDKCIGHWDWLVPHQTQFQINQIAKMTKWLLEK